MTRGRKRKPTNIKVSAGTLRKHRELENEMLPAKADSIPEPPDILKGDKMGLKLWNTYTQTLFDTGNLFECDLTALIAMCKCFSKYFEMQKHCDDNGYVDENGKRRAEDIIGRDALNQAMRLSVEFGFTPSARTKIPMGTKKKEDEIFDK